MSKIRAFVLRKLTTVLIKYGMKYGPTILRYKKRYENAKRRLLRKVRFQGDEREGRRK